MIKPKKKKHLILFELYKNGRGSIDIDGNAPDMLAGVLTMVKDIYQSMQLNSDEFTAEWFLQQIGEAMLHPENPLYEEVRK